MEANVSATICVVCIDLMYIYVTREKRAHKQIMKIMTYFHSTNVSDKAPL